MLNTFHGDDHHEDAPKDLAEYLEKYWWKKIPEDSSISLEPVEDRERGYVLTFLRFPEIEDMENGEFLYFSAQGYYSICPNIPEAEVSKKLECVWKNKFIERRIPNKQDRLEDSQ